MDEVWAYDEYDMLMGNINRMFNTDDAAELAKMHDFARKRIERIFEYHRKRLNNK